MTYLFSRWLNRRRYLIAQADEKRDQGRHAEAAQLYQQIIDKWKKSPSLLMQLGNALKDSGNYDEAYATYIQVWESKNRSADVALQLGHLFKLKNDLDTSKKWYSHSIDLDGNDQNPAHHELIFLNGSSDTKNYTKRSQSDMKIPAISFPEEATLRHFRTALQYRPS